MKISKGIILLLISIATLVYAEEIISITDFPSLTVSYEGKAKVFNKTLDKLEYDDPFYHAEGDKLPYIKVLEIIPDEHQEDLYSIIFHMGEAGISSYEFYLEGEFVTPAFILYTDHLDFAGDGVITTRGSMNQMFTISKKYRLSKGQIKEIAQPFYAVDIESTATRGFDIFKTKRMKRSVDTIEKDENLKVILAEFKKNHVYYLLRSDRGLTGWIKIEQGTMVDETPIKDLYFHGD